MDITGRTTWGMMRQNNGSRSKHVRFMELLSWQANGHTLVCDAVWFPGSCQPFSAHKRTAVGCRNPVERCWRALLGFHVLILTVIIFFSSIYGPSKLQTSKNGLVLKLKNRRMASHCAHYFVAPLPNLGFSLAVFSFEFRELSHQKLHPIYR